MIDRASLTEHVKWAEAAGGPELFPYKDTVGKITIGYGRNLDDRGISKGEAELLLRNDIDDTLMDAATLPYWEEIDSVRRLVVADMVFNLGLSRFLGFKKLNAALAIKDYTAAAHEMKDSKWYHQVERRAKVLHKAMLTGVWDA